MKRIYTLVLGAAALAAVQGCSKEAALYLGGPAGPISALAVSSSRFDIRVGQTVTIGAKGVDAVGNMTTDAPTFAACDAAVSVGSGTAPNDFSAAATLTGAGLGASCVNVSAGGLSQTIVVNVGPAALSIVGDPIVAYNADDPSQNGPFDFTTAPVDGSGSALTGTVPYAWGTSDTSILVVDPEDGTILQTKKLGSARLWVTAPGGANDIVTINVAAPLFTGTTSASSGVPGDLVTLTRAGGGAAFTAAVTAGFGFGGLPAFIDAQTADNLTIAVPSLLGVVGRSDLVISKYGPSSLDRRVVFSGTSASPLDKYSPGNIDNACNVPGTIPVFENVESPSNAVYIVHDARTYSSSCIDGGDPGDDHWFTFTTPASGNIDLVATWMLAGDYDLVVCDTPAKVAGNGACAYGYSGNSNDETMTGVALTPSTQYWFAFEAYDASAGINNVKIVLTKN